MAGDPRKRAQLSRSTTAIRQFDNSVGRLGRLAVNLAAASHNVVTTEQLHGLGFDSQRIARWVASGRLHRIYRGVYSVGRRTLSQEGRWLAAVRACGPGALLSHLSAAALWGMLQVDPVVIHISAAQSRRGHDGIRLHRRRSLPADARHEHLGIPVTSPAQTWFDLASMLSSKRLKRALSEGERGGILTPASLSAALTSRPGARGQTLARRILKAYRPAPAGTGFRSDLERDFWEGWMDAGHEPPEVNAWACGFEIDLLWRRRKLAVEVDGGNFHRTAVDRENDRAREAALRTGGFELYRFSDKEIEADLPGAIATVAAALARRRHG